MFSNPYWMITQKYIKLYPFWFSDRIQKETNCKGPLVSHETRSSYDITVCLVYHVTRSTYDITVRFGISRN
jgi:hypothetical protein